MSPQIKSLTWGFLIGALVGSIAVCQLQPKQEPPLDLRPFQDSIKDLKREWKLAEYRSAYRLRRADSLEHLLITNKKKLRHDIKVIEAFTPDLRRVWNDSVLRANGLR